MDPEELAEALCGLDPDEIDADLVAAFRRATRRYGAAEVAALCRALQARKPPAAADTPCRPRCGVQRPDALNRPW